MTTNPLGLGMVRVRIPEQQLPENANVSIQKKKTNQLTKSKDWCWKKATKHSSLVSFFSASVFRREKFDLNEKTGMPPEMPSKKFVKLLNPEF